MPGDTDTRGLLAGLAIALGRARPRLDCNALTVFEIGRTLGALEISVVAELPGQPPRRARAVGGLGRDPDFIAGRSLGQVEQAAELGQARLARLILAWAQRDLRPMRTEQPGYDHRASFVAAIGEAVAAISAGESSAAGRQATERAAALVEIGLLAPGANDILPGPLQPRRAGDVRVLAGQSGNATIAGGCAPLDAATLLAVILDAIEHDRGNRQEGASS